MATKWPMHRHLVQDTGHDASCVNRQYFDAEFVWLGLTYR